MTPKSTATKDFRIAPDQVPSRRLVLAGLMRTTALASLGLLATAETPAKARTPADQLIIGHSMSNILSLDPSSVTSREAMEVVSNVYDFMITIDPVVPGKLHPAIAQSWTVSPDHRSITLKLGTGAKFHSGNAVTSADVVWSLQRALKLTLDQASLWRSHGYTADNAAKMISAPDPATVIVRLPQPDDPALILDMLASNGAAAIVDSKIAMMHDKNGDMGGAWLTTHDAGSGPFTLQSWQANNLIILQRFDGYARGPATMRRVIYRHMPESQTQRLSLERGDIDIAMNLVAADFAALKQNSAIAIRTVPGGNVYYLAVSLKVPHFADKRVRLALRTLIDYEGINATIMPFYGVSHQRPIPKDVMGDLPDPNYKLDVAAAKKLLTEAGLPDGFSTTIRVLAESPFINAATSIQSTLSQAGIKASIQTGDGDQVYGAMRNRSFEMVVGRGGGGEIPHPDSSVRAQIYDPDNRDAAKLSSLQGWRTSFFDPDLNKRIDAALVETDAGAQRGLYEAIQREYADAVPAMQPFSQAVTSVGLRTEVKGYVYNPSWTTMLRDVKKQS